MPFAKGQKPWNAGKKLNYETWNKNKKMPFMHRKMADGFMPVKAFKKGNIPWNKDKVVEQTRDEKNGQWKGDKVGYDGLHDWVKVRLGLPKQCSHCHTTEAKVYHWANVSGEYRRELDDWIRLCVPCHKNMTYQERIKNWSLHSSQRGWFAFELYKAMASDPDIYLIVGDLGYGMFNAHFEDFPDRTLNSFAAEQAAMGIAVGLALEGKKPFIYSITTFLLYRPFETIRNYIDHERIPVRLVGGGRDKDYAHDGFSHWSEDIYNLFDTKLPANFPNITALWPEDKEEIPEMVNQMVNDSRPWFISLRR